VGIRLILLGVSILFIGVKSIRGQVISTDTIKNIDIYQKQIKEGLFIINELRSYKKNLKSLKKHLNFKNENEENFVNNLKSAEELINKYNSNLTDKNVVVVEEKFRVANNLLTSVNVYFCLYDNNKSCLESIQFIYNEFSDAIRDMIVNKKIDEELFFEKFPELKGK